MESSCFTNPDHYNKVQQSTWGHLFPSDGYYEGSVTFTHTVYGNCVIIKEDIDIDGSPWWFDSITQFMNDLYDEIEEGTVYVVDISVFVSTDEDQMADIHINKLRLRKIL
jgi:hypothetical protein